MLSRTHETGRNSKTAVQYYVHEKQLTVNYRIGKEIIRIGMLNAGISCLPAAASVYLFYSVAQLPSGLSTL
eukprot:6468878-Amphidinium_carterae.2